MFDKAGQLVRVFLKLLFILFCMIEVFSNKKSEK